MSKSKLEKVYSTLKSFSDLYNETTVNDENTPSFMKFKTGGMRAVMKEGLDGINDITANILGSVLVVMFDSIVIGYDHRVCSDRFAYILFKIFKDRNKRATIFKYCTTPYLAWESLKYDVGVMVTASHNPKEYNGFKVYKDGCQVVNKLAEKIEDGVKRFPFTNIFNQDFENKWRSDLENNCTPINFTGFFQSYKLEKIEIQNQRIPIFSGIFGVSPLFIKEARSYFNMNINLNSIQNNLDNSFPNIPFPNPEAALPWHLLAKEIGLEAAKIEINDNTQENNSLNNKITKSYDSKYYFMCDPDGDRFGMAKVTDGKLKIYNGNEISKIFLWYFLKKYKPHDIALVSTFLCDDFFSLISKKLNIRYVQTKTGFKNVSDAVKKLQKENFHILAYEDTLGYLIGESTERDGVKACVIMHSILQESEPESILNSFSEFGQFYSYTVHIRLTNPEIVLKKVLSMKHFEPIHDGYFRYEDQFKITLRVSGTEPVLKVYAFTNTINEDELKSFVDCWINSNVTKLIE